jgi:hypothetical protein
MVAMWPPEPPPDPIDPPPEALPGLGNFLRKRYTCNVAVTEQMNALDLLNDVIFVSSRLYLAQAANGKLSIKNKKPSPWALCTEDYAAGGTTLPVDSVIDWIDNVDNWLLIAPHTNQSEIHRVIDANYSTAQNSVGLSSTGGLFSISGFSGCDGGSTPATASITVTAHTTATTCTITLEGVTFTFRTGDDDTNETIASYIAGVISSHPSLYRRYRVSWVSGSAVVDLTAVFGDLELDTSLQFDSASQPISDPTAAPVLAASASSTAFPAGTYAVAYAWVNAVGETLLSPFDSVIITAGQKIDVSTVTMPGGVTSVKWFVSPTANSSKLRYIAENDGTAFSITTLPLLSAPLPPDLNRTGTEVLRVAAVFSDREEVRSATSRSNVIKATFQWLLGSRSNSINRIDLKYRDARQDWRLIELRLRDDAHIAKIKKTSPKELNGQAIDNTDQAYRIAAGALAEQRDADFFYKWRATREALLLQEADVVAITDRGSGVYNFPVILEQIEFDISNASLPGAAFTGRKYSSTLYDDSIVDRTIPVLIEDGPVTYLTDGSGHRLTNEFGGRLTE